MEIPSLTDLLFSGTGILVLKIPILVLIGLYALFLFIVLNRLKAFDRIVQIPASGASRLLRTLTLIQLFLTISLFFLALVIV